MASESGHDLPPMASRWIPISATLLFLGAATWYVESSRRGSGCVICEPLPPLAAPAPVHSTSVPAVVTPPALPTLSVVPGPGQTPPGLTPPGLFTIPPLVMPPAPSAPEPPPFTLPYPPPRAPAEWSKLSSAERLKDVDTRVAPLLKNELAGADLRLGAPAYLRAFKESAELELWMKGRGGWKKFRTYPIAAASGGPGPKLKEGDGQVPEGFYSVGPGALNPASLYHLSFNIGYPNTFDRHHQRTGSAIMVHGSFVSVGCLAMTDPVVEEIYLVVQAALQQGQRAVPVHIFPFRMTAERMAALEKDTDTPRQNVDFWQMLKPAHDVMEEHQEPPAVVVREGRYELAGPRTRGQGQID